MDNGSIDPNQTVGLTIRNGNASGSWTNYNTGARFEFFYSGNSSSNSYKVVDADGVHDVGMTFTTTGMQLIFTLGSNDTYKLITIDNGHNIGYAYSGTLGGTASSTLDSIAVYNRNAGSGASHDVFFNSLRIVTPVSAISP